MNIKIALVSAVLPIALTLPALAGDSSADTSKTGMKRHDMSGIMGKPTSETTVGGLHIKVWLMSQKDHSEMMQKAAPSMMMKHGEKEGEMGGMGMKDTAMGMGSDMKEMKHGGMQMDSATKDAMMAGTHHIGLELTDAAKGTEIADAAVTLLIGSPSKKNSSVDLKPMMAHFGSGLTLDEKGEYKFTLSINAGGVTRTTKFRYTVN